MRKLLLILLCLPFIGFAQSVPQGINYQAVARDANGDVLMNQALTIQFSVISDITTSAVSWQETHTVTTNDYGLYTAIIGQGISTSVGSSATFDVIDWGAYNHLLKVEVDFGGGLVDMGTTAFMSVPYSMNAKTAETASNVDSTDELQSLSISGDTLFISSGNSIVIPGLSFINSLIIQGCTDPTAFNYDANANTDDGSCVVIGCMELLACNYNSNADSSNFSYCDFSCYSCSDVTACNYDSTASIPQSYINLYGIPWDALMLVMNLQSELGSSNYYFIENQIDFCDENFIAGFDCECTESYSSNMESGYGSNSFVFTPYVCGDTAMSGNTSGYATVVVEYPCNVSNGFWSESSGYSVIDITIPATMSQFTIANSSGYVEYNIYYDSQVTSINQINVGPYVVLNLFNTTSVPCQTGCTDSTATNYNALAITDDGSCIAVVNGCTDPTAFNYDLNANTDDGSCTFGCTENTVVITVGGGSWQSEVSWTITEYSTPGVALASGSAPYDSVACLADGCYTVNMVDSYGDGWNGNHIVIIEAGGNLIADGTLGTGSAGDFTFTLGTGICPIPGCTDSTAFNYNAAANTDDGSCIAVILGCTDPLAFNFETLANTDDGSCIAIVNGCTDATACNYDALANVDDSSCILPDGCTDPTALNYDATATCDDGSCASEIGDLYQGGIIFHLDGNGGGLIAAFADQTYYGDSPWGCYGTYIPTGNSTDPIGTGSQNTINIVAGCAEPYAAANICANYTYGTYSDWFLPSFSELLLMYQNIGQGNALGLGNVGNFAPEGYWSSNGNGYNHAFWIAFWSGLHEYSLNKNTYLNVRPIRAF